MSITVKHIRKSFDRNGSALVVFDNLSFQTDAGLITSLVGPSGCGKSTLLNILSGLDKANQGTVEIAGMSRIGYLMQDPLMLPWRTLTENATLGAEVISGRTVETSNLVRDYFVQFDLTAATATYPNAASGGMKQRVALIRTLVTKPQILLLDEPFASLDFDVKLKIQRCLIEYHETQAGTTLIVTHDIDDAIALSDRIIVLSDKPTTVKTVIPINLGLEKRDPVRARKSPGFSEYFSRVWDEIKYLQEGEYPTATD